MVDEQHEATEVGADGVGGADELGHVFAAAFVALDRAVQRVDDDYGGWRGELAAQRRAERCSVGGEVDGLVDEVERRVLWWLEAPPPRFDATSEPVASFEREVDDGALAHVVAAIGPVAGDVHDEVVSEEALAALRRPPDDAESDAGQDAFDDVVCERRQGNIL